MKLIKVQDMNVVYLARHWLRWYYIDTAGYWNPVRDVIIKLRELEAQEDK